MSPFGEESAVILFNVPLMGDFRFQTQILGHIKDPGVAIVHEGDAFFWGDVIGLHQPPEIRVEVLFDFVDELLAQEEFLFPCAFGGVADIVVPPQAHPLAQMLQLFHPVLTYNLRGYIR
jgi:hypothetical protein